MRVYVCVAAAERSALRCALCEDRLIIHGEIKVADSLSADSCEYTGLQKTTGQSLKHGGADAGDTLFFSFFRKGYAFIVSYGVGEVPESKSPYP